MFLRSGNDVIALLLAVPTISYSIIKLGKIGPSSSLTKPSLRMGLIYLGGLWYMFYNYIYYGYGAAYNPLFILYISIIALSTVSMVLLFGLLYKGYNNDLLKHSANQSFKSTEIFMIVFACIIGGMWIFFLILGLLTNELPMGIEQTGHPTGVVFITDLVFLVTPLYIVLGIICAGFLKSLDRKIIRNESQEVYNFPK